MKKVYFLTVHSPYQEPDAPGPVNGLITHARTLLHPDLPQPDAGRIYRCLTEFPGRFPAAWSRCRPCITNSTMATYGPRSRTGEPSSAHLSR